MLVLWRCSTNQARDVRFLVYDSAGYISGTARVVELVDTQDLKSCDHCGRAGSSPAPGTISERKSERERGFSLWNYLILTLILPLKPFPSPHSHSHSRSETITLITLILALKPFPSRHSHSRSETISLSSLSFSLWNQLLRHSHFRSEITSFSFSFSLWYYGSVKDFGFSENVIILTNERENENEIKSEELHSSMISYLHSLSLF